jgi:hypothetical protein
VVEALGCRAGVIRAVGGGIAHDPEMILRRTD